MRPAAPWRAWTSRIARIGPSRLALGFAVLLVIVSLALPVWSLGGAVGADQEINSFGWTMFTMDRYHGTAWNGTTILPYTSTQFAYRSIAGVIGNAYVVDLVFLVVLAVVLGLFSLDYSRNMPTLSLLVVSLIVLATALFALFYPIVAIPPAATTDVGAFTIGGFWGSASSLGWSWSPGLGWWILLVAVVLGNVGAVLPYLRSIRAMVASAPKAWRPSP